MKREGPRTISRRLAAGSVIRYATAPSPVGWLLFAATERGLCQLDLGDNARALVARFRREHPKSELVQDELAMEPYVAALREHLGGRRPELDLPLDIKGTEFQRRVWGELRRIPYGRTRSYGEVARAIRNPKATRAVAQACGANPIGIVIPCHRVVASDGGLGGYTGGIERKRKLLEIERGAVAHSTSRLGVRRD